MCALGLDRYCDVVANNNELVPRETRKKTGWPRKSKQGKEMNTNIKRLLDPRQQTKQNITSNNGKETEM